MPLTAGERAAFAAAVRRRELEARQEQGYAPEERLGLTARAAVTRAALQPALVDQGLLAFA
jgi:hypothetical protein